MSKAVLVRGFLMEFIYIICAIFDIVAINGIRMPIFSNLIAKPKW